MTTNKRVIRQAIGFEEEKIEGFSMIAKSDIAIALTNKLTGSQLRLWLYLLAIDPFADKTSCGEKIYHPIPSPQEIAIRLGASAERVQKDLRRLEKLGLYTIKVTAWEGYNESAEKAKQESERLKASNKNQPSKNKKTAQQQTAKEEGLNSPSQGLNSPSQGLNSPSQGLNSPSQGLNSPSQAPESAPSKQSKTPQTIQTYTDFIQTLSDAERELFFQFVGEEIKHLEQKVVDIEAWLASTNAAGIKRWSVFEAKFNSHVRNLSKEKVRADFFEEEKRRKEEDEKVRQAIIAEAAEFKAEIARKQKELFERFGTSGTEVAETTSNCHVEGVDDGN